MSLITVHVTITSHRSTHVPLMAEVVVVDVAEVVGVTQVDVVVDAVDQSPQKLNVIAVKDMVTLLHNVLLRRIILDNLTRTPSLHRRHRHPNPICHFRHTLHLSTPTKAHNLMRHFHHTRTLKPRRT
jgi:hypothetical protein